MFAEGICHAHGLDTTTGENGGFPSCFSSWSFESFRQILTERFGRDGVDALVTLVTEEVQHHSVSKQEFYQIGSRIDRLEGHMERLDLRMEHLEERVNSLDKQMVQLREEFAGFRSDIDRRFEGVYIRMDNMSRDLNASIQSTLCWSVGTMLGIGTFLGALMVLFKFL